MLLGGLSSNPIFSLSSCMIGPEVYLHCTALPSPLLSHVWFASLEVIYCCNQLHFRQQIHHILHPWEETTKHKVLAVPWWTGGTNNNWVPILWSRWGLVAINYYDRTSLFSLTVTLDKYLTSVSFLIWSIIIIVASRSWCEDQQSLSS